ncbi:MAG TPA: organic hydroperoxide resistance protein, partial [Burkholderiaceae bacterium]|nr:organic hydroperoxide resistance protein [Burkholderiaceae bacterium]
GIAVTMAVTVPGMDRAATEALVKAAHEVCPYSNATRGNIDVALSVA